jgi:hypothetical protein
MIARRTALTLALACGHLGCDEPSRVIDPPTAPVTPAPIDDRPVGYPLGFPVVEGARVLEGSVDEGVIRTSSLEYTMPCTTLEGLLRAAFTEVGARVLAKTTLEDETISIRASVADQEASFSMRTSLGRCVLRTIASDRGRDAPENRP